MKKQLRFTRAFIMALAIAAISMPAWAAGPPDCGMVGTWYGNVSSQLSFFAVHSAGTSDKKGVMVLNWVTVKDDLLVGAARLTEGRGVWEQVSRGQYKYTWYAYGINADGGKSYSVRVSGIATNVDCDNIAFEYTFEVFGPFVRPQDMSGQTPFSYIYDTDGAMTRVPLTVVPPPPPS